MAEDRQDTPQKGEGSEAEQKGQRLSERLAMVDPDVETQSGPDEEPETDAPAEGYRRHFVREPGRMVLGARMSAPNPRHREPGKAPEHRRQFSKPRGRRRRGISTGVAALLLCAVAAVATAGLTMFFDNEHATEGAVEAAGQSASTGGDRVAQQSQPAEGAQSDAGPSDRTPVVSVTTALKEERGAVTQDDAAAQLTQLPQAGLTIANVSADAGEPAPIDITVERRNSGEYAFLMFRGLPKGFTLSAGFPVKGSWAVSLTDVTGLKLLPPPGYRGRFDLQVLLVKGRETPIESRAVKVNFRGADPDTVASVAPETVPVPHVLTATPPSQSEDGRPGSADSAGSPALETETPRLILAPEDELPMLKRAFAFLGEGDVVSGRMLLEHLARQGSGKGALALAQTYDPLFFGKMGTLGGPKPDPVKARKWYTVAFQLGQDGAKARLSTLPEK